MDIFLLIIAIICLFVGFVGCIIPMLPGPPITWLALLLIKFTRFGSEVTWTWIMLFALAVIIVSVLDYYVPMWGTKKFGGTKAGTWGATIGFFVGLFFSPVGIIVGPFIGALIGELMMGSSGEHSLKAALGAFVGFLVGIGLKLIVCVWITIYFAISLF